MKRRILILSILLAMALAHGRMPISLGGDDSLSLLKNLTNNSSINSVIPNVTGNATANSSGVLSAKLGGDEGLELFKNLTNGSSLAASGNLTTWGSKPRPTPPVPKYDPKQAQMIQVIRDNHIA